MLSCYWLVLVRNLPFCFLLMKPTHAFHRFLTLAIAGLLLLLSGGGGTWVRGTLVAPQAEAQAAKKAQKAPTSPDAAVVKAATDEAVVSASLSFDYAPASYLLPAPSLRYLLHAQPLLRRIHEVPYFYFSYLRYVFGHFIAPNAP
jgi:hypothetical protein